MQDNRSAHAAWFIDLARDVHDLAGRAAANGLEPVYGSEKLGRAAALIGEAFALMDYHAVTAYGAGYEPSGIAATVQDAYDRTIEALTWTTCARCAGFGYTVNGGRPRGDEPASQTADCSACRGHGQIKHDFRRP
jgi:hypothetical protein